MEFTLSPSQIAYQKSIIEYAREELNQGLEKRDASGRFWREGWRRCAKMGYLGLLIPEEYGGTGEGLVSTALCLEALSRGCRDAGLVHAIVTQACCAVQIKLFGSEMQKQQYLPAMAEGTIIGAQAMTEPDAGSDVGSMLTNAQRCGETYRLNGTKQYITNGPLADLSLVFARSESSTNRLSCLSCFAVRKDTPGFTSGPALVKMGLRTLQNSELFFTDCSVPAENIIGREGQGQFIFQETIQWERILMAACHLGSIHRNMDICIAYAKRRSQFGQTIGKFQAVSHKIADMRVALEMGRLMAYKAAWLKDQGKSAGLEASIAKLFNSEKLKATCLDAIQLHGAYGYMEESGLERDLRDSVAGTIYSGTSEILKNVISSYQGL